ncbi:hypothetical protein DFH29DRAFT_883205 [Suillus ampliporus]|nr:hypothetical protein DFH29DRAFT_883205 [Suillus ampliporus]
MAGLLALQGSFSKSFVTSVMAYVRTLFAPGLEEPSKMRVITGYHHDELGEYPTVLTLVVYADLNCLVDHHFNVLHICRKRSAWPPPLRAYYSVQASHCHSVEHTDLVFATEIPQLSVLTLTVYAVVALLNTSWSTLLLPPLLQWPVPMFGTELDLGSVAFANQLSANLPVNNGIISVAPAFITINVLTLISGIIAIDVEGDAETTPIFNFNGVAYNRTTDEYSGASNPSQYGLAFSGGKVPVNTSFDWGRHGSGNAGIAKNYTVTQQGATADVTCRPIDRSKNSFTIDQQRRKDHPATRS